MEITSTKNRLFISSYKHFLRILNRPYVLDKKGLVHLISVDTLSLALNLLSLVHLPVQQCPVCVDHTFVG